MHVKEKRILVIGISVKTVIPIELFLIGKGYLITSYTKNLPALEHLACYRDYDLIICDNEMPNLNRLELISKAKKINANIKVLLLTSNLEETEQEVMKESGAHGVVEKPFKLESLEKKISKILSTPIKLRHEQA